MDFEGLKKIGFNLRFLLKRRHTREKHQKEPLKKIKIDSRDVIKLFAKDEIGIHNHNIFKGFEAYEVKKETLLEASIREAVSKYDKPVSDYLNSNNFRGYLDSDNIEISNLSMKNIDEKQALKKGSWGIPSRELHKTLPPSSLLGGEKGKAHRTFLMKKQGPKKGGLGDAPKSVAETSPPSPPIGGEKSLIVGKAHLSVEDSIKDIIKNSLSFAPDIPKSKADNAEWVFIGDIHGELDMFLHNLYITGIIDKNGNLRKDCKKNIVLTGDHIDKGPYNVETLIYINALQNQAQKAGINFHVLTGNHEYRLINDLHYDKNIETDVMRRILHCDILNDRRTLAFGAKNKNLTAFHGGMEKKTAIESIRWMSYDNEYKSKLVKYREKIHEVRTNYYKKQKCRQNGVFDEKFEEYSSKSSSKALYKDILFSANLNYADLTSWMNKKFKEAIAEIDINKSLPRGEKFITEAHPLSFLFGEATGVEWDRMKAHGIKYKGMSGKDFLIDDNEKYNYKPIQITGHNPTKSAKMHGYGMNGGIKQNHSVVFIDAGMSRSYGAHNALAFMDRDSSQLHKLEIVKDNAPLPGRDDRGHFLKIIEKLKYIKINEIEGLKVKDTKTYKDFSQDKQVRRPLSKGVFSPKDNIGNSKRERYI